MQRLPRKESECRDPHPDPLPARERASQRPLTHSWSKAAEGRGWVLKQVQDDLRWQLAGGAEEGFLNKQLVLERPVGLLLAAYVLDERRQ